jgi:hypothetical protein
LNLFEAVDEKVFLGDVVGRYSHDDGDV